MVDEPVTAGWPAHVSDSCGEFFGTALRAANAPVRPDARVLEIGCCEYDWLAQATESWPEMTFTGLDWRRYKRPGRATVLQGDVMAYEFPEASFDWIVSVSAIEHIGLGHYSHDPIHADGDRVALRRCWHWLAPGGWLYFDVPYNPGRYQVVRTAHRIYDDAAITERLDQGLGWREHWRGIADKGDTRTLITDPAHTAGGESFYYIGLWWQKPGA